MGKTSTAAKRKYNKEVYSTHLYSYRKRSDLGERISAFKAQRGTSLNFLITKLLAAHFGVGIPVPETDNDDELNDLQRWLHDIRLRLQKTP